MSTSFNFSLFDISEKPSHLALNFSSVVLRRSIACSFIDLNPNFKITFFVLFLFITLANSSNSFLSCSFNIFSSISSFSLISRCSFFSTQRSFRRSSSLASSASASSIFLISSASAFFSSSVFISSIIILTSLNLALFACANLIRSASLIASCLSFSCLILRCARFPLPDSLTVLTLVVLIAKAPDARSLCHTVFLFIPSLETALSLNFCLAILLALIEAIFICSFSLIKRSLSSNPDVRR